MKRLWKNWEYVLPECAEKMAQIIFGDWFIPQSDLFFRQQGFDLRLSVLQFRHLSCQGSLPEPFRKRSHYVGDLLFPPRPVYDSTFAIWLPWEGIPVLMFNVTIGTNGYLACIQLSLIRSHMPYGYCVTKEDK